MHIYVYIYIVLVCFVIAMRKMERVAIKIIYVLRLNNSGRIVVHSCPHDDTQQCLLREKLMAVGPPLPQKWSPYLRHWSTALACALALLVQPLPSQPLQTACISSRRAASSWTESTFLVSAPRISTHTSWHSRRPLFCYQGIYRNAQPSTQTQVSSYPIVQHSCIQRH